MDLLPVEVQPSRRVGGDASVSVFQARLDPLPVSPSPSAPSPPSEESSCVPPMMYLGRSKSQVCRPTQPPLPPPFPSDLRRLSVSSAQTSQMARASSTTSARDVKLKKAKSMSASRPKPWGQPAPTDADRRRRKRVARYNMYGVEGRVKWSVKHSLRWLKKKYSHVVYGWS